MPDLDGTTERSLQSLLDAAEADLSGISDSARLDAEVLLCHCLNKPRSYVRTWPDRQASADQRIRFQGLLARRIQGEPIAYLTGQREFWSRSFDVTADVLIPRPDSELLIDLGLGLLPSAQAARVIDLGTGSGILAITLAAERPLLRVFATDVSEAALTVAQKNAERLQVSNVSFILSHWFNEVQETGFDLVLSNPPYIADDDPHLLQGDVRFEPKTALISPEQGLKDIRLIAAQARLYLKAGGYLMLEHGYRQSKAVQAVLNELDYRNVTTHCDLSGNPRVTLGLWKPT
jgi:release factor glutamine methyltransferase